MKLLANENFPIPGVRVLIDFGYDIVSIALAQKGISDRAVLRRAIEEDRIILTFDRDYGALIFKHHIRPAAGVIYLRLGKHMPEQPGLMIHELLSRPGFDTRYQLTMYDGIFTRQRPYNDDIAE